MSILSALLSSLVNAYHFLNGTSNWFLTNSALYTVYKVFLKVECAHNTRKIVVKCHYCEVDFLLDSRARKSSDKFYCLFGCRKKHKTELARQRKLVQRAKGRKLAETRTPSKNHKCTSPKKRKNEDRDEKVLGHPCEKNVVDAYKERKKKKKQ